MREKIREALKTLIKFAHDNQDLVAAFLLGILVVLLVVAALFYRLGKSSQWQVVSSQQEVTQKNIDESTKNDDTATPVKDVTVAQDPKQEFLTEEYMVEAGDSLWSIAESFYGCGYNYVDLAAANGLAQEAWLEVGMKLELPKVTSRCVAGENQKEEIRSQKKDGASLDSSTTVGMTITGSEMSIVDRQPQASTYEIQPGDSLWSIALEQTGNPYNWPKIYHYNRSVLGKNPDLIYPETEIVILKPLYPPDSLIK